MFILIFVRRPTKYLFSPYSKRVLRHCKFNKNGPEVKDDSKFKMVKTAYKFIFYVKALKLNTFLS